MQAMLTLNGTARYHGCIRAEVLYILPGTYLDLDTMCG